MYIRLPNGSKHPKSLLNNAIYASDRAFPLISISKLDKANFSVSFNNGICEIKSPTGFMMATTPCSNRLYMITQPEEHQKPGHIKYSAFKRAEPEGYCTYQPNNKSVNPKNWRVKTNLWPNHFHSREIAKNRKEPHFVQQECSCEIT